MTLTVLSWIEEGVGGIKRGEEEETRVDCDAGGDEGNLFEVIQLASEIRPLFGSESDEHDDEKEDRESLYSGAECLKEDRDEDHGYFAVHDDTLPVVGARVVAIEEESVLALHLSVV